jgi:hypothetical protein
MASEPSNPPGCLYLGQVIGEYPPCSVEGTLYGYEPNMGANVFFAAFFAVCFFWQLFCGIKYKTWTFMVSRDLKRQLRRY